MAQNKIFMYINPQKAKRKKKKRAKLAEISGQGRRKDFSFELPLGLSVDHMFVLSSIQRLRRFPSRAPHVTQLPINT